MGTEIKQGGGAVPTAQREGAQKRGEDYALVRQRPGRVFFHPRHPSKPGDAAGFGGIVLIVCTQAIGGARQWWAPRRSNGDGEGRCHAPALLPIASYRAGMGLSSETFLRVSSDWTHHPPTYTPHGSRVMMGCARSFFSYIWTSASLSSCISCFAAAPDWLPERTSFA